MEEHNFLEIEVKYDAGGIDRLAFKALANSLKPKSFLYIESKDVYYAKNENEFLRHRNPPDFSEDKRSELTFKKKTAEGNNNIRVEINLRVDANTPEIVEAFCLGLGYTRNFTIVKYCDIFWYEKCDMVYYTVTDEEGKSSNYVEIEVLENLNLSEEESWAVITEYEKLLAPLGITSRNRKRLSLWEMYRK